MGDHILVVVNDIEDSMKAVMEAARLAGRDPENKVILLNVFSMLETPIQKSNERIIDLKSVITKKSEDALLKPVAYLEEQGVAYEKLTRVGNPVQEICMNVRFHQCKMLLLSGSPNEELERLKESVLKKVTCPIQVV
ncbi:universal stress protein [Aquibacillus sp. 3ASR75-11]|uniref:Universal stress protein n=1 Tax=Terrihalobacillus insolitus TaxID=2950438 RepID=A0A9X4AMA4_9BACI|nr:universal stress protein [Terrihalobacillus insolitus]MDC3413498.1 universal stress protein [Terrihalobacillus insolitus]MDC3425212.1 universal stress protein [Terrihalobacillus insolitus]